MKIPQYVVLLSYVTGARTNFSRDERREFLTDALTLSTVHEWLTGRTTPTKVCSISLFRCGGAAANVALSFPSIAPLSTTFSEFVSLFPLPRRAHASRASFAGSVVLPSSSERFSCSQPDREWERKEVEGETQEKGSGIPESFLYSFHSTTLYPL